MACGGQREQGALRLQVKTGKAARHTFGHKAEIYP